MPKNIGRGPHPNSAPGRLPTDPYGCCGAACSDHASVPVCWGLTAMAERLRPEPTSTLVFGEPGPMALIPTRQND